MSSYIFNRYKKSTATGEVTVLTLIHNGESWRFNPIYCLNSFMSIIKPAGKLYKTLRAFGKVHETVGRLYFYGSFRFNIPYTKT